MSSRTFSLDSDSTVYARVAADLRSVAGWSESKKGDVQADVWLVDGRKKGVASSVHALLGQSGRAQLVNYCRGSTALTLKSSMIRTLRGYLREQELDQEAMGVPTTFVVYPKRGDDAGGEEENAGGGNSRPKSLKEALAAKKRAQAAASDERSDLLAHVLAAGKEGGAGEDTAPIWIAKASAGGKGEGICISRSCDKLLHHVDSSPSDTAWVVSRYLQDPMLIDGRKFDVRCWVLLDAKFRVFVFQDGECVLARVCICVCGCVCSLGQCLCGCCLYCMHECMYVVACELCVCVCVCVRACVRACVAESERVSASVSMYRGGAHDIVPV